MILLPPVPLANPRRPAIAAGRANSDAVKALTYLAPWAEERPLLQGENNVNAALKRAIDRRLAALPSPARDESDAQCRRIAAMHGPSKAGTPMPKPAVSR